MIRNILLIEGDGQDAQVVRNALTKSAERLFRIHWVKSCAQALERLAALPVHPMDRAHPISAMLVDLSLPDLAGLAIVDRLFAAAPKIPIIALSSQQDEAVAKNSIAHGAQDYLLKEHLNDYLLPKTLAAVIERASITEALFDEKELAQVTLNSIGDGVISTDVDGEVAYMNQVAEQLTGWSLKEALGRPLDDVLKIIKADTRTTIASPLRKATQNDAAVELPPACVLIRRDGIESEIEDSSAPIHDRRGKVTGAVMVFRDVGHAKVLQRKLAHVAQHDGLTDLPNRSMLLDRLEQAIADARRHHTTAALLYLDLDRFKPINDSLGHLAGDRLLQSVAQRLTNCVRSTDTVCRLGGDEFVILLAEVAREEDAVLCADKVLQTIRMPYVIDGQELHVTASIGIALFPNDGTEVEALLQNADSAMYEAKERGRNKSQSYREELNATAGQRQLLECNLRHAVQRQELELHYQPIMNLHTGAIAGVEALVRWRHPADGLVLPDQFIAIAEESGLIVPIGQWVLGEACRQTKEWQNAGFPLFRVAVNVSAAELRTEGFAAGVAGILSDCGLEARHLELELTETFLLQDSKATAVVLGEIKALGVQLALDDFGTGYSSLSYMRRFPIDTLKVDRSFVRDLIMDDGNASVVTAIINMGKSLNMRVVAEGIETPEQLAFLKEHGCSEAQGYHFSRPLTGPAMTAWMHRRVAVGVAA